MATFQYQHGDRPLEGYTIEHGVGRGGFGEVYYAISDSGRQVALKAVQNFQEVELRGIGHCMNLKNPHLVTIFDLKHNQNGQPFVIMEYVSGPSLRELLDAAPEGLGTAKAAYFVREIAKGLAYLHSCGIVHRDLKPHNVFYEDGFVKIGDYSLSKVISASHKSGHTVTVGTVHYMAPEISMGRYDHKVDIYALGVLLHEMLTGVPPFVGDSVGEVLMKHVAGEVDVSGLEEPYATVIRRALAKDPDQRYESVDQMVADLFGDEHVHSSVSAFDPGSLTQAAQRRQPGHQGTERFQHHQPGPRESGFREPHYGERGHATVENSTNFEPRGRAHRAPSPLADLAVNLLKASSQFAARVGIVTNGWPNYSRAAIDPLGKSRWLLAAIAVVLGGFGALIISENTHRFHYEVIGFMGFWLPGAIVVASSVARRLIVPHLENDASFIYRMVFGGLTCLFSIPAAAMAFDERMASLYLGLVGPTFALDWRSMSSPIRPKRLALTPALFAALLGGLFPAMFTGEEAALVFGFAVIGAAALGVQLVSPFDSVASRRHADDISWLLPSYRAFGALGRLLRGIFSADRRRWSDSNSPSATYAARPRASRRLRFPSLVLSLVPFIGLPIAGLQRFYVGKFKTGVLWLCTLGLAGVGQLIDVIMICVGRFRDRRGRIVHGWTNPDEPLTDSVRFTSTPVNHLSSVPVKDSLGELGVRIGGFMLNLVGAALLLGALVVGLIMAVDLPNAIAAGVMAPFDVNPDHISYSLGMEQWPRLAHSLLGMCATTLWMLALVTLIFARRGQGIAHIVRVCLSFAGLMAGLVCLYLAFGMIGWSDVGLHLQRNHVGPALDAFLHPILPRMIPLALSAVMFVLGFFLLAWPAKKRPTAQAEMPVSEQPSNSVLSGSEVLT